MSFFLAAGTALSVMGTLQAGQSAKAQGRAIQRQKYDEARMLELRSLQDENARQENLSSYLKEIESIRAINRREYGDRSYKALVKASKGKNREELARQSLQTLYGIGKEKYAGNIAMAEGKAAMQAAYIKAASTAATGIYRYQQITAPKQTGD